IGTVGTASYSPSGPMARATTAPGRPGSRACGTPTPTSRRAVDACASRAVTAPMAAARRGERAVGDEEIDEPGDGFVERPPGGCNRDPGGGEVVDEPHLRPPRGWDRSHDCAPQGTRGG